MIHIRKQYNWHETYCGDEIKTSVSYYHFKFGIDEPESMIGEHLKKLDNQICQTCKEKFHEDLSAASSITI